VEQPEEDERASTRRRSDPPDVLFRAFGVLICDLAFVSEHYRVPRPKPAAGPLSSSAEQNASLSTTAHSKSLALKPSPQECQCQRRVDCD